MEGSTLMAGDAMEALVNDLVAAIARPHPDPGPAAGGCGWPLELTKKRTLSPRSGLQRSVPKSPALRRSGKSWDTGSQGCGSGGSQTQCEL